MKRIKGRRKKTQLVLTWRFENPMAPHVTHFVPTTLPNAAMLVRVITTMLDGAIVMTVWFKIEIESRIDAASFARYIIFDESMNTLYTSLGLRLLGSDDDFEFSEPVYRNGDAVRLRMEFDRENGKGFCESADEKFIKFVNAIKKSGYPYILPNPEIVHEDLIEAYSTGTYIPFGQDISDMRTY